MIDLKRGFLSGRSLLALAMVGLLAMLSWTSVLQPTRSIVAIYTVCSSSASDAYLCDYRADGVDDQVEINAALGRGTVGVTLSEGRFYVTDSILLGDRDVLMGQGRSTSLTIPVAFNRDIDIVRIDNKREWLIEDLQIDGDSEHQTAGDRNGIKLIGGFAGRIDTVWFWAIGPGYVSNAILALGVPEYITISNCHIDSISDDGLDVNLMRHSSIYGNTLVHIGDNGIDTEAGKHMVIADNVFSDIGAAAIEIEDESGRDWSEHFAVTGNSVHSAAVGVLLNAGRYSTVSGNTLKDCGVGVRLSSFAGQHSTYNVVSSNVIQGGTYGIQEVDANQDYNLFTSNILEGQTATAIQRAGPHTVVGDDSETVLTMKGHYTGHTIVPANTVQELFRVDWPGVIYWAYVHFRGVELEASPEFGVELDGFEYFGLFDSPWEMVNNLGPGAGLVVPNMPYLIYADVDSGEYKWINLYGEGRRFNRTLRVYIENNRDVAVDVAAVGVVYAVEQ